MENFEQPEKEAVGEKQVENKNLWSETLGPDEKQTEKKPEEKKEEEGGKKAPENNPENNSVDPNGNDSRPLQSIQKDLTNEKTNEPLPTDLEEIYRD